MLFCGILVFRCSIYRYLVIRVYYMFDLITNKFSSLFAHLTGSKTFTENNIEESCVNIKEALLEADVPYDLIETFVESIKKEVVGQRVLRSLKPTEQFIKIVNDKLISFL